MLLHDLIPDLLHKIREFVEQDESHDGHKTIANMCLINKYIQSVLKDHITPTSWHLLALEIKKWIRRQQQDGGGLAILYISASNKDIIPAFMCEYSPDDFYIMCKVFKRSDRSRRICNFNSPWSYIIKSTGQDKDYIRLVNSITPNTMIRKPYKLGDLTDMMQEPAYHEIYLSGKST